MKKETKEDIQLGLKFLGEEAGSILSHSKFYPRFFSVQHSRHIPMPDPFEVEKWSREEQKLINEYLND